MIRIVTIAAAMLALSAPRAVGQTHAFPEPPRLEEPPAVLTLRSDLAGMVAGSTPPGAVVSALVVSLDRGDTLFAVAPEQPLAPASNMKIYTTAAALYYLGPEFRYVTSMLFDGELRGGTLAGDVILRGTGDPSMSDRLLGDGVEPLRRMAGALRALGVDTVTGDVVGDGGWFDRQWVAPAWEEDDLMTWYAAPVGGLNFAENMVRLRVLPGAAAGAPARLATSPATVGLAVRNDVRTVSSGATRVRFDRSPDGLVVSGTIRRGHGGVMRVVPVVDPANYAAAALHAVLADSGVTVLGETRSGQRVRGRAEGERVVTQHLSPTLLEIATATNHVSHNLFAEALLKTMGRAVGREGSFEGGARAVRAFLGAEAPAALGTVAMVDGSGLSRPNRASTAATVAVLEYVRGSELADGFVATLPEAGSARGLKRMYDTPASGNLRAKTGTIREVSALSGYVTAANGELLAFSIISNGVPASWRAKSLEDRIAVRLAGFTR